VIDGVILGARVYDELEHGKGKTTDLVAEILNKAHSNGCNGPDPYHCCYVRRPKDRWCAYCLIEKELLPLL
jgi:hypothetical protein